MRAILSSALLATILSVSGASNAIAGALVDAATKAEALVAEGKADEAIALLRSAQTQIDAGKGLRVRKALFVTEKPLAFGAYSGAASNQFPVGSTLISYTEPAGLTWKDLGNGKFATRFTVDFELRNPAGELLAAQKAFGSFSLKSTAPLHEVFTPLTLDVSAVPKGDYVVRYIFTDVENGKTASVDQPFSLK